MANMEGDYRFSTAALIALGSAALVFGGAAYTYLWGTLIGAIGLFVFVGGVPLVIIGIVRAVRDRREHEKLVDQAAKVSIESTPVPGGGLTRDLQRLVELHKAGDLSDKEFAAAKAKVLQRG